MMTNGDRPHVHCPHLHAWFYLILEDRELGGLNFVRERFYFVFI